MYQEKQIASDLVTFQQHQLDGWATDIAQPMETYDGRLIKRNLLHLHIYKIYVCFMYQM